MEYAVNLVTAPALEPLTVAEVKQHLQIFSEDTTHDTYITALITTARIYAEKFTKRALITQTWDMVFNSFYGWKRTQINIPFPNLQSVTWVKYYDSNNVLQTLDSATYTVDSTRKPGRIYPAYGQYWPATLFAPNACTVRFIAGYGSTAASVPETIKQGMLIMCGHWFENREPVVIGSIASSIPRTADDLLRCEQVLEF